MMPLQVAELVDNSREQEVDDGDGDDGERGPTGLK